MFRRNTPDAALTCSFCQKSQDLVAKLISTPSDYPRAYICDECVRVCQHILYDDVGTEQVMIPGDFIEVVRRWLQAPGDEAVEKELRNKARELLGG